MSAVAGSLKSSFACAFEPSGRACTTCPRPACARTWRSAETAIAMAPEGRVDQKARMTSSSSAQHPRQLGGRLECRLGLRGRAVAAADVAQRPSAFGRHPRGTTATVRRVIWSELLARAAGEDEAEAGAMARADDDRRPPGARRRRGRAPGRGRGRRTRPARPARPRRWLGASRGSRARCAGPRPDRRRATSSSPVPTAFARTEANFSASSPRLEPSIPTMIFGRLVMGPTLRGAPSRGIRCDRDRRSVATTRRKIGALSQVLLAVPFGLAIGFVVGAVGGGGAILALPVLVYVLGQGVGPASTASLIVVAVAAAVGDGTRWHATARSAGVSRCCSRRRRRPARCSGLDGQHRGQRSGAHPRLRPGHARRRDGDLAARRERPAG